MKTNSWLYVCVILFSAFFWMKTGNEIGLNYYLLWIFLHLILLSPVLIYTSMEGNIRVVKWRVIYWIGAFILAPMCIYVLLQMAGILEVIDRLLAYKFIPNADIYFLVNLLIMTLVYFMLQFTANSNFNNKNTSWVKRLSVFKILVFCVLLLSLAMPLISTDFQKMSESNSWGRMIGLYLLYVPQIFMIYFSYYLFYYINHHILFKKVFTQKGAVAYVIGLLGLLFALTPVINLFISLFPVVYEIRIHPIGAGTNLFDDVNYIFPTMILIVSFPIILIVEWNRKNADFKALEIEKRNAELSLIKQQINPHFFFNTLNNLYALSLEKADAAPELILKLSKLMRFVIYKGKYDLVSLSEELQYIQDYIDLQKLRLKQEVDIKFYISPYAEPLKISPMMLIVLVENAFKHGIEPSEKRSFIHLNLEIKENNLYFSCRNSIDADVILASNTGIGLANLRMRLEFLYPQKHELLLQEMTGKFEAILQIKL